ncbi:MAG: ABC transporter permease [Gammaproteobacteria bacterium]|jgi:predicted permease
MRIWFVFEVLREWVLRLFGSFRIRSRDQELRAELADHLERAEERFKARGYSPREAARLARFRYGHAEQAIEDLRRQQGIPWFGVFTLDVKLGLRMLRKHLGLTLIGGLAMTVGFGIIFVVFAYFDLVMWSDSVPLDEGDRVVAVQVWDQESRRRSEIRVADFERWQAQLQTLVDVGAFRTVEHGMVHPNGEIENVSVAEVSAAGFELARVAPVLGRTLVEPDESGSAAPVIVIGYNEWQSRFNGAIDVLGETLRLGDRFYTIVGVMPEGFGFPVNHQFWIPLKAAPESLLWAPPAGAVFGRLAPGVGLDEAQAELLSIGLLPRNTPAETDVTLQPTVLKYAANFIDDTSPGQLSSRGRDARMIIFFVSLLLIPPCVNIAMLIYARLVTRKEEIAVRTALGASRRRIVLQLFIEMMVLSTIAATLGLVLASLLLRFTERLVLSELGRLPFWLDIGLSMDTLIFAAAIAVLAALIIGVVPALGATRSHARPGLATLNSRYRQGLGPVWTLLIIAQVAFPFAALPSAVELGWGVLRSHVLGPGFAAERYMTAQLSFDGNHSSVGLDDDVKVRNDSAREAFIRRLEADSRVLSPVTAASAVPGEGQSRRVRVEREDAEQALEIGDSVTVGALQARSVRIDDRYLDAFDFELLTGREFEPPEYSSQSRSVLVNATFAETVFPGLNPLGRRLTYASGADRTGRSPNQAEAWFEIVGVVADRPAHPYRGSVFHPADLGDLSTVSIGFRSDVTDGQFREAIGNIAANVDPALRVVGAHTLQDIYDSQAVGNYMGGTAIAVVSLSVLALAAAGTYALMSFTVNQRRREIAIRIALGAGAQTLLHGVFRSALRQLTLGAGIGFAIALLIQSYVPPQIIGGLDVPGVLPGAILLMVAIGLAASLAPARRVLRTDPTVCLSDSG